MKEFKYKDLVKFPGQPLQIYEVVSIREYEENGKKSKVYLLWGINVTFIASALSEQIIEAKPYWDSDEDLPFKDITVDVPLKRKTKSTKEETEK